MGKMISKKAVQKLQEKVNKSQEIHLNECPRCGKDFPIVGDYQFEGSEYYSWANCPECGITVRLVYEFHHTEIVMVN